MASDDNFKDAEKKTGVVRRVLQPIALPALAIVTALVVGALIIIFTAGDLSVGLEKVVNGYWGMVYGAFLKKNGLVNTLVASTPLILTGLAVAIPFRAGLFNIGAEGQFLIGALLGTLAGIYVPLPPVIHTVFVMFCGFLGGAIWGFIPGILRARLGSHEVINTIMLNFIAISIVNYAVRAPFKDPNPSNVQTLPILRTAELMRLSGRLHLGFFIAIAAAILMFYFLFKTTWGFSLRTTGQNPDAADYAGIRPKSEYVIAMMLAGGLAGLAGVIEVQGLTHVLTEGSPGYGFDAIAVSLLALNHPLGIIPAAFVFGALRTGGDFLQIRAGLSVHIVSILQALILLFVAAPAIVRHLPFARRFFKLLRIEVSAAEGAPLTRGWGG